MGTLPTPPGKAPPAQKKGGLSGIPGPTAVAGTAPRFMTYRVKGTVTLPPQMDPSIWFGGHVESVHSKRPGASLTVRSARGVAVPLSAQLAVGTYELVRSK